MELEKESISCRDPGLGSECLTDETFVGYL